MPKPLPNTQRKILQELAKGTQLLRSQAYAWAPIKYLLGDKAVPEGSVAVLAMKGYIAPVGKIEIGQPEVKYLLTQKGEAELAKAAA